MIKHSIKTGLQIKGGHGEDKEASIRLRVSWRGQRVDLPAGYVVAPSKWDGERGCVRLGAKNSYRQTAGEINRALLRLAAVVEGILERWPLEHGGAVPSAAELKAAFDEAEGRGRRRSSAPNAEAARPGSDFFDAWDRYCSEVGAANNWSPSSYAKHHTLREHLKRWRPDVSLADFDKNDLAAWVAYLQNDAKLLNTTVAKHAGFLRCFLRWAAANNLYGGHAHEFRQRFRGLDCKEVVFLTWEELHHFLRFDFSKRPRLGIVRDVFCFCCFTSLRYSDVFKLRRSDLHLEAVPPYMEVVTKKTTARLRIELNKYALELLDRYASAGLPDNRALPVISNQKMNDHLHEAGRLAGLNDAVRIVSFSGTTRQERVVPKYEVLTSHCGRRTFVVNALRMGIPPSVVMEWTGHSNYKAMTPYIKIVDESKAENMALFDRFEVPEETKK
jgi:integrase